MAASKARQRNLIQSLAGVVGLDGQADPFDVLKGVAETLGMSVAEDGTAVLAEVGHLFGCLDAWMLGCLDVWLLAAVRRLSAVLVISNCCLAVLAEVRR